MFNHNTMRCSAYVTDKHTTCPRRCKLNVFYDGLCRCHISKLPILKIQATWRGYKARKLLKKMALLPDDISSKIFYYLKKDHYNERMYKVCMRIYTQRLKEVNSILDMVRYLYINNEIGYAEAISRKNSTIRMIIHYESLINTMANNIFKSRRLHGRIVLVE